MDFNMVANQSTSASKLNFKLEDLGKMLTKLHFDKKKKKSKNQAEWNESLRTVLATADLREQLKVWAEAILSSVGNEASKSKQKDD